MHSQKTVSPDSRRRGIALLVTAAMSIVVLPMVGLSVDVGILYVVKTKLSAATDAAAIAGARTLNRGVDFNAQRDNAIATASNYFRANFPNAYLLTSNSSITTTVLTGGLNSRVVTSSATATVPVYFLRFLKDGQPSVTVNVGATATRRDSNVILVMDRSASLAPPPVGSGSCAPMKVAAAGFVDKFAEQTDYLGLATFASSGYYLDYPIATNFKSSTPSMTDIIGNVNCVGGTNSVQGLWNGYTALAQLNQPGALNVIVFFTDGDPTAFPATFPIKTSSPCTSQSSKTAVLTKTTNAYGLLNLSNGPVPILTNENAVMTNGTGGCQFRTAGADKVSTDIASIPAQDYFGDNTTGYYGPVTAAIGNSGSTNATSIENASLNAADNAARRIRNGAAITAVVPGGPLAAIGKSLSGVVIFSLGLGNSTNPPNADFLRRVANAVGSSSPDPDPTKPVGVYIEIKTVDDLDQAFKDVAAEVLRLSK